ncbi:hypothetical protein [Paraburkholderia tuberum]|uniref:hypothetical protein n=1 Tax=Paraburkholderia tuberum TaxID=157910 RepID=UPI00115F7AE4|nr:hypothetical protein [Paraburkholderia tuberum]
MFASNFAVIKPSSRLSADRWHSRFVFAAKRTVGFGKAEDWVFAKKVGPEIFRMPALWVFASRAVDAIRAMSFHKSTFGRDYLRFDRS